MLDTIVISNNDNVLIEVAQALYNYGKKTESRNIYVTRSVAQYTLSLINCIKQCRDYVNSPFNIVNPLSFSNEIVNEAGKYDEITISKISGDMLLSEGLNCIYNVGRASEYESHLIIMSHQGDTSSNDYEAIIGKGVTFDTGGINLKSSYSLQDMHTDMAGAATAFEIFIHCVQSKSRRNIVIGLPICENAIGKGLRPGDIIQSHSGIEIEIENTDAEGRLILIDIASYIEKFFNVSRMFILATLTGMAEQAFGPECAPFCCDSNQTANEIKALSKKTDEMFVHLTCHEQFNHCISSQTADIKNIGEKYGEGTEYHEY